MLAFIEIRSGPSSFSVLFVLVSLHGLKGCFKERVSVGPKLKCGNIFELIWIFMILVQYPFLNDFSIIVDCHPLVVSFC